MCPLERNGQFAARIFGTPGFFGCTVVIFLKERKKDIKKQEKQADKKRQDNKFFFTPLFCCCFGSGIRDPDPGSGMKKNQDPGSGMNIPDPEHWFFS